MSVNDLIVKAVAASLQVNEIVSFKPLLSVVYNGCYNKFETEWCVCYCKNFCYLRLNMASLKCILLSCMQSFLIVKSWYF